MVLGFVFVVQGRKFLITKFLSTEEPNPSIEKFNNKQIPWFLSQFFLSFLVLFMDWRHSCFLLKCITLKRLACVSGKNYRTIYSVKSRISWCRKPFLASNFGDRSLGNKKRESFNRIGISGWSFTYLQFPFLGGSYEPGQQLPEQKQVMSFYPINLNKFIRKKVFCLKHQPGFIFPLKHL